MFLDSNSRRDRGLDASHVKYYMSTFDTKNCNALVPNVRDVGASAEPVKSSPIGAVVRTAIGALLLFAAGIKGYELATGPVAEKGLLTSRWFRITVVEVELALATCLVGGLWKRLTWWTALLCFMGFSCVTAYKAWQGEASCGCLGRAEIDPRYTLVLDCFVVLALLLWPVRHKESSFTGRRLAIMIVVGLGIGVPGGIAMASFRSTVVTDGRVVLGGNSLIVLDPQKWLGKKLPILQYIDIGTELSRGNWIVVLYDVGCSHCQQAIPEYHRIAQELAERPDGLRLALVALPSSSETRYPSFDSESPVVHGQLSATKDWFAQVPVEMILSDGVLTFVKEQGEGLRWFNSASR